MTQAMLGKWQLRKPDSPNLIFRIPIPGTAHMSGDLSRVPVLTASDHKHPPPLATPSRPISIPRLTMGNIIPEIWKVSGPDRIFYSRGQNRSRRLFLISVSTSGVDPLSHSRSRSRLFVLSATPRRGHPRTTTMVTFRSDFDTRLLLTVIPP
ncbi:hypothetical protein J6590_012504 [Homalodisca vitripennis]|nr:hypothetical protein J6590_012504 [Homalodisca vitripennis]